MTGMNVLYHFVREISTTKCEYIYGCAEFEVLDRLAQNKRKKIESKRSAALLSGLPAVARVSGSPDAAACAARGKMWERTV